MRSSRDLARESGSGTAAPVDSCSRRAMMTGRRMSHSRVTAAARAACLIALTLVWDHAAFPQNVSGVLSGAVKDGAGRSYPVPPSPW